MSDWAEDNGSYGACLNCGRRTWIEHGCAPLCGDCDYPDEMDRERTDRPQTLADVGMCEEDFR